MDSRQWLVLPDLVLRKSKIDGMIEAPGLKGGGTYVHMREKAYHTSVELPEVLKVYENTGD